MMARRIACLTAMAALSMVSRAVADAEADYDKLFGEKHRRVVASPTNNDDVAFAVELLDSADKLGDSPRLQTLMRERAYRFALRTPEGYDVADRALRALKTDQSDRSGEWREKRLELSRLRFRDAGRSDRAKHGQTLLGILLDRANEAGAEEQWDKAHEWYTEALQVATALRSPLVKDIREEMGVVQLRRQAVRLLEVLLRKVKEKPFDTDARTDLVRCLVIEHDKPGEAVKHLADDLDVELRTYVPLAAKDPGDLPESACLEVAEWYRRLTVRGTDAGKLNTLGRAKTYLEHYLSVHAKEDVARLKAKQQLAEVIEQLRKLPGGLEQTPVRIRFEDPKVQKLFEDLVKALWARQNEDGSWSRDRGQMMGTAAAVTALLETGVSARDRRIAKAIGWLKKNQTTNTSALAWRCMALRAACRTHRVHLNGVAADARFLLASTVTGMFVDEVHGRPPKSRRRRNEWALWPSLYGLLAVDAAAVAGIEVPAGYWAKAGDRWLTVRRPDGGWSNRRGDDSDLAPTAAGVVATTVCFRQVANRPPRTVEHDPRYKQTERAIKRLDKLLAVELDRLEKWNDWLYPTLHCVSLAGRETGRGELGGVNWFKRGSDLLVKRWDAESKIFRQSWPRREQCMALGILFLVNGHHMESVDKGS